MDSNGASYYAEKISNLEKEHERQGGHHEVLDNIKIKYVSTTRYILSPRHQIGLHVSATL